MTVTPTQHQVDGDPSWYSREPAEVAAALGPELATGLTTSAATRLLEDVGPNALTQERKASASVDSNADDEREHEGPNIVNEWSQVVGRHPRRHRQRLNQPARAVR